jgi:hypothetical protein
VSDFLTRLVERTLGLGEIARPDLGSTASASAAARISMDPAHGGDVPRAAADAPSRLMRPSGEMSAEDNRRQSLQLERSLEPTNHASSRALPTPAPVVPTDSTGQERSAPTMAVGSNASISSSPKLAAPDVPRVPPSDHLPFTSQKRVEPSTAREIAPEVGADPRPPASSALPTVTITIGRIEVRSANTVARQPNAATPATSRPLRSLETYLRERNGSRS